MVIERSSSTSCLIATLGSSVRKNCGIPSIFNVELPNGSRANPIFSRVCAFVAIQS